MQTESVKLSNKQTEYADADHIYTNDAPEDHHQDQDHGGPLVIMLRMISSWVRHMRIIHKIL